MQPKIIIGSALGGIVVASGIVVGVFLAGGGATHGTTSSSPQDAFLHGMIPHHQGAIDMANLALQNAEREELKSMAREIIRTQTSEITTMERILGPAGKADHGHAHGGDDHGRNAGAKIKGAQPFDKAFLDLMIPHHESAIQASIQALPSISDPEVRTLAQSVIDAQEKEIVRMKEWRKAWYGS